MGRAEAQQVYKQRGAIAEFPNACIKDKISRLLTLAALLS